MPKTALMGSPLAVIGTVFRHRRTLAKTGAAVGGVLMLPILFLVMLPGLVFGDLSENTGALTSNTVISENIRASNQAIVEVLQESHDALLAKINAEIARLPEGDTASISDPYASSIIVNANQLIAQFCASQDDYKNINISKLKSLIRENEDGLFSYDVTSETATVEVPAEEENAPPRKVTFTRHTYTVSYAGDAYFADHVFHLTDKQKKTADSYVENLTMFFGGSASGLAMAVGVSDEVLAYRATIQQVAQKYGMSVKRIKNLVKQLNEYRHAYYNQDAPLVSDAEYDRLFDELKELEEQTGFILSNSPTQTVGYYPVSELAKVTHPIPLLSLEKTKLISELLDFMKGQEVLFMLKLDGLTTKLIYEDGRLIQASTRGDGEVGEDITHNIPAFLNVPLTIPHKERLVITGESFIPTNDFERLKDTLRDGNGKPYKNGRNFASGSVRSLDPKNCIGRCVRFLPFNVLEGMEDVPFPDSRACKLEGLTHLGFGYCPFFSISGTGLSKEYAEKFIQELVSTAANLHLPIDGIVMIFDSLSYSKSCGKTGHHYKDGLAYKFEDDTYETFLREIEWTPTRFGEIAPVGIFDTVEIDGCDVSRASLHNLTFIKNLELVPGCRILVSKRNMIIPHIEDNLDRGRYTDITPPVCPCCGSKTRTYSRKTSDGRTVETLHCDNPQCDSQITRRFVHFASKKAMNIEGLSEATLEKFLNLGYLHSFQDIYHLEEHREDIVALDGYGEKSFDRLWESINASRRTSFVRYLVSMDIPMIGRTKSRILDTVFSGNLTAFEQAAVGDYDFTQLEDFGEILNHNIHSWFADEANLDLWKNLQNEFTFEQRKEEPIMTKENKFTGCTIVATGKLEHFTRDGINDKILELGAKPGSSVTKKTDYLICGEKAGSKLAKAQSLGIPILTEAEFLEMIA